MTLRIRACWQLSCRVRVDRETACKSGRVVQGVRSPTGPLRAVSATTGQRRYSVLPLYCLDMCVCVCVCCEVANSSARTYSQIISLSDVTLIATCSHRLSFASHAAVCCSHSLLLHRKSALKFHLHISLRYISREAVELRDAANNNRAEWTLCCVLRSFRALCFLGASSAQRSLFTVIFL